MSLGLGGGVWAQWEAQEHATGKPRGLPRFWPLLYKQILHSIIQQIAGFMVGWYTLLFHMLTFHRVPRSWVQFGFGGIFKPLLTLSKYSYTLSLIWGIFKVGSNIKFQIFNSLNGRVEKDGQSQRVGYQSGESTTFLTPKHLIMKPFFCW